MMVYRDIIIVLLILFFFIGYTNSLQCFSCADCGDPFDINLNETITMNGTDLYCQKTKGASIVDRNITQGCSPFTAVGNGVWCCTTDLCNHAINSRNSFSIIFLLNILIAKFI